MKTDQEITLHSGIYTLPDAALILRISLSKLRRWVVASEGVSGGMLRSWGAGRGRAFDFNELIESYTIYSLRNLGVSMPKIKLAHKKLSAHFQTDFPFAKKGMLSDRKEVLFEIDNDTILNVSHQIQSEFRDLVIPFCVKIEFDDETDIARKFWPLGRSRNIVVDPRHSFGRPVIAGTNIPSEIIYGMKRGGEDVANTAFQYDISEEAVLDAIDFHQMAA